MYQALEGWGMGEVWIYSGTVQQPHWYVPVPWMDYLYDDIISRKAFFMFSSDVYSYCMFTFRSSAELLLKYDASTNIPDNSGKHTLITFETHFLEHG